MSPAAGRPVHDLDLGLPAFVFLNVPEMPFELFVLLADGGSCHFSINEQVYAGLSLVVSAADEEVDELPRDLEAR